MKAGHLDGEACLVNSGDKSGSDAAPRLTSQVGPAKQVSK
jgi:hypothetical protein